MFDSVKSVVYINVMDLVLFPVHYIIESTHYIIESTTYP